MQVQMDLSQKPDFKCCIDSQYNKWDEQKNMLISAKQIIFLFVGYIALNSHNIYYIYLGRKS